MFIFTGQILFKLLNIENAKDPWNLSGISEAHTHTNRQTAFQK
jgi:hypothetical protein